nr:unnamed protein product [Spirometra erinaceieuropaei]
MIPGNQLCGYLIQYERVGGRLKEAKRWAKLSGPNLDIFADKDKPGICFKIIVYGAQVDFYRESSGWEPWISITEESGAVYYFKPENSDDYDLWCSCLKQTAEAKTAFQNVGSRLNPQNHQDRRASVNFNTERLANIPVMKPPRHRIASKVPAEPDLISQLRSNGNSRFNRPLPKPPRDEVPPALPPKLAATQRKVSQQSRLTQQLDVQLSVPKRSRPLETVKESASQRDSEIIPTGVVRQMRSKYPVTGLARRMSISASDLLGKSRDELVLLLLQLNREKANLTRWQEYFTEQINSRQPFCSINPKAAEEMNAIMKELEDVENQLEMTHPLVSFMDNMIRLGDLYAGDDAMFATEYRKHLLRRHEYTPLKPNVNFMRHLQEKEVAKALNRATETAVSRQASVLPSSLTPSATIGANPLGLITTADLLRSGAQTPVSGRRTPTNLLAEFPEEPAFRQRRLQLEAELQTLERIWDGNVEVRGLRGSVDGARADDCLRSSSHLGDDPSPRVERLPSRRLQTPVSKKALRRNPSDRMADSSHSLIRSRSSTVSRSQNDVSRLGSHPAVPSACLPRRSTKRLQRSDLDLTLSRHRKLQRSMSDMREVQSQVSMVEPLENLTSRARTSSLFSFASNPDLSQLGAATSVATTPKPSPRRAAAKTASSSSFLAEPATSTQSRWKRQEKPQTRVGENAPLAAVTMAPPIASVSPPAWARRRVTTEATETGPGYLRRESLQSSHQTGGMNKWKSLGENLSNVGHSSAHHFRSYTNMHDGGGTSPRTGLSRLQGKLDALVLNCDDSILDSVQRKHEVVRAPVAGGRGTEAAIRPAQQNDSFTGTRSPVLLSQAVIYGESDGENSGVSTNTETRELPPNLTDEPVEYDQPKIDLPLPVYPENIKQTIRRQTFLQVPPGSMHLTQRSAAPALPDPPAPPPIRLPLSEPVSGLEWDMGAVAGTVD